MRRLLALTLAAGMFLSEGSAQEQVFSISSPDFAADQMIPADFTCDGANRAPRLTFSGVPEKTESLVLIVDDPDAPSRLWVHWVVFNLPPSLKSLDFSFSGLPKDARSGANDFGRHDYGGPCPPSGEHHYHFKLYALDRRLDLSEGASKKAVEGAMREHILAQTRLIGRYASK